MNGLWKEWDMGGWKTKTRTQDTRGWVTGLFLTLSASICTAAPLEATPVGPGRQANSTLAQRQHSKARPVSIITLVLAREHMDTIQQFHALSSPVKWK